MAEEFLTQEDLAKRWKVPQRKINYWSQNNSMPIASMRDGRRVYMIDDVEAHEKKCLEKVLKNKKKYGFKNR